MKRVLALTMVLSGCVTAMGERGVQRLTTCENSDLKKIRQSLLKNGYEVRTETETTLTTDYKLVDAYGGDERMRKITVEKMGEGTFRFKEHLKTVRGPGSSAGMFGGPGRRGSGISLGITVGDPIELESDQEYYEERREEYEAVQREVCG